MIKNVFLKFLLLAVTVLPGLLQAQDIEGVRLSKISYYNFNANKPKPDAVYDFIYEPNGTIKKINYYQDGKLFEVTDNYKFNSNGKIISYDTRNVTGNSPRHHFIDYDDQGRRKMARETLLQDGETVNGNTIRYYYGDHSITAIKEVRSFAGSIYDSAIFKTDAAGHIEKNGMNKAHPNPLYLTGNSGLDIDAEEWPVAAYYAETPVVYRPSFGTTTTEYHYDNKGLLNSYSWKYVTEKENLLQSTGKTLYTYMRLKP